MSNKNDSMSHTYTKGSGIAFGSSIKIDAPPCYSDGLEVGNRDLTWVLRRQSDLEEKLENIERSLESLRDQLFGCSEDDTFSTKFSATNAKGERVGGAVCSGWLKGSTIRFD